MIQIKTKGEALDLPSGFSIEIEDSNPIFNERGSQSIPATIPATRRNIRLLDAPHRIDTGADPNFPERTAEVVDGAYIRRGAMNITEAGKAEGITFNVGFDNSTAYAKWSNKKLADLQMPSDFIAPGGSGVRPLLNYLYEIYQECNASQCPFAVFPVATDKTEFSGVTYWEILNIPGNSGLREDETLLRVIDSELTEVTVPPGYGVSPFIRVWKVIDIIFSDLGLSIQGNPFKSDPELARLVVLNNAADAACIGVIRYSDLLPDSTVEEFLNALWVRFGLVYDIDNDKGFVRLRLLRDIISSPAAGEQLTGYASGHGKITYNRPQYVKLSASTSIEGAAPANERFEDFARGLDISHVYQGNNVGNWKVTPGDDSQDWEGDLWLDYDPPGDYDPDREGWDEEWDREDWDDNEDPDDGRDDEREDPIDPDDGRDDSPGGGFSGPMIRAASGRTSRSFLAREMITGQWYRLDSDNGRPQSSSSGFFNWDPATEGMEPFELSSSDEWVPVKWVSAAGSGYGYSTYLPCFLSGSRHYHSYIAGSEEAAETSETPLAFMFAYCIGNRTIGRISPEDEEGLPVTLSDGTHPSLSLLFQFKDGLFANFWASYDEILRHGNRSIEVQVRIPRYCMHEILDFMSVKTFRNIKCIIDTASYSLPSGKDIGVALKMRTMQTHGDYDIGTEQNIPPVSAAMFRLEWRIISDKFGRGLDTPDVRIAAVSEFKESTGYENHGVVGAWHSIDWECLTLVHMERLSPTWRNDPTLPTAYLKGTVEKNYLARLHYEVRERFDPTPLGSDEDLSFIGVSPIGTVAVDVSYAVKLKSVKIAN